MVEVIDNFLDKEYFNKIKNFILSEEFPWYYNDRISNKTIQMFSNIELKDEISNKKLNKILKDLYETNFFEDVNVQFKDNILTISVKEYPIIQKINYIGIKSKTLLEEISSGKVIRDKSPYNIITLEDEKNTIVSAHNSVIKCEMFINNKCPKNPKLEEGGFYILSKSENGLKFEYEFHKFKEFTRVFYER